LIPFKHLVDWELFNGEGSLRTLKERQAVFDALVVRMLIRCGAQDALVALNWVSRAVHPNLITSCHEFMIASKHMDSWVFMEPAGLQGTVNSRICPADRTNILMSVSAMSTGISGRARHRSGGVPPSLPPSFPSQQLVPQKAEEKVLRYLRDSLVLVEQNFHESLMLVKALSALRDQSRDFAEQYHFAESNRIIAEGAVRLAHRAILSWRLRVGPIRQPVSSPSTS